MYRKLDDWLDQLGVKLAAPEDQMEEYFQSLKNKVFLEKTSLLDKSSILNAGILTKKNLSSSFQVSVGNNKLLQKREQRRLLQLNMASQLNGSSLVVESLGKLENTSNQSLGQMHNLGPIKLEEQSTKSAIKCDEQ